MANLTPHIAVYLDTVDPLFLPKLHQENSYPIVGKDTALYAFAQSIFTPNQLLPVPMYSQKGVDLSEKSILYNKTFLDFLKQKNITHLVIPSTCSKSMKEWAKQYNITLIGTVYDIKFNLENKIDFDAFLKEHKLSSPSTIALDTLLNTSTSYAAYVVQKSNSSGLEGTWLCRSKLDVEKKVKDDSDKSLIREYLPGLPIGVSIFIDQHGNYFFSAIRSQCYSYKKSFPATFLGIQWLPTSFFSDKLTRDIYHLLTDLTIQLVKKAYIGIFNIDLVIHNNKPYILECNPRLSAATAQVFSIPNVTNHSDPYGFFLNTFLHDTNQKIHGSIPTSEYQGALLALTVQKKKEVKYLPEIGVYEFKNNMLCFLPRLKTIENIDNQLLMLHYLKQPGTYKKHTPVCSIITHTSLFDFASGTVNPKGEIVYRYFHEEFFGEDEKK
jgi:hypothetical protein